MDRITSLPSNHIFVFGSNRAGQHLGGAAADAYHYFGAQMGVGIGMTGRSYAIPTLTKNMTKMRGPDLISHIHGFMLYAQQHPKLTFVLTPIGTGIAGWSVDLIADMFWVEQWSLHLGNVVFPPEFTQYWDEHKMKYEWNIPWWKKLLRIN